MEGMAAWQCAQRKVLEKGAIVLEPRRKAASRGIVHLHGYWLLNVISACLAKHLVDLTVLLLNALVVFFVISLEFVATLRTSVVLLEPRKQTVTMVNVATRQKGCLTL